MKVLKKLITIFITTIFISMSLIGCNSSKENEDILIFLPEGNECIIQVIPVDYESDGDVRIVYDRSIKLLNYNMLTGMYEAEVIGNGENWELKIDALEEEYEINLINCEYAKKKVSWEIPQLIYYFFLNLIS